MPLSDDRVLTYSMLQRLAMALTRLFSPGCEVVIHDFTDLERSIVHIEGNITNRSIGGAATDLLLKCINSGETDKDLYDYITTLPGGRLMKSSTIFLHDADGTAYGAFCINFEVTSLVNFRNFITEFLDTENGIHLNELFSDDIHKTIHAVISETTVEIGKENPILSRDDKVELIARLDAKGIFQVKRAVSIVADQLGISRATIYNYLAEARGEQRGNGLLFQDKS
jgi:predicted transcriptional regulator YheO